MLNSQELANYLVQKLEEISATRSESYKFSILAEIATDYDGGKINGMVHTVSTDLSPLPAGTVQAKYTFVTEIFIPGTANKRYQNVNGIINEFITKNQCSSVAFGQGNAVLTFTMGVPKGYKIAYGAGEGIPLAFTVYASYTENIVTSADKHWLLDDKEIPFISESVSVEREGIPRKVYTEVYTKILLTGQTKYYTFRIPYESEIYKSLQQEILNVSAVNEKRHTLTYYDGMAFTADEPFETTVSIYRSGSSSSARPDPSVYEITFTDIYDNSTHELWYDIALIDFPFDMQGDDTRYFSSQAEQISYFNQLAGESSAPFAAIEAPNLDGIVITKQVYRPQTANGALSQFDYAQKNYAIIRVRTDNPDVTPQYFYYFITNSQIGADGCIMVDLKLDSVQTYFFNPNITFSDCLIERAHLNRFVPVEGDPTRVKFVTDPASKIYNAEQGLSFPKRLVQRDKLRLKFTGQLGDSWLNDNVAYWVYIFIDPTHEYEIQSGKLSADETKMGRTKYFHVSNPFNGATSVISYPVYKNAQFNKDNIGQSKNVILFKNADGTAKYALSEQGRIGFEEKENNVGTGYYYTIKLSCIAPFSSSGILFSIDSNNNLIVPPLLNNKIKIDPIEFIGNSNSGYVSLVGGIQTTEQYGVCFGSSQNSRGLQETSVHSLETFSYALPENAPILKADIIKEQPPQLAFNPKLNGQNFKELTITASSGDEFSYDIQKLNNDSITFEYSEPIIPEITKYYLRVTGGTGLYEDGTDDNYTGLVGSTDTSVLFTSDKYKEFLANNKNFYLQSNMKIGTSFGKSIFGLIEDVASGDIFSAVKNGISTAIDTTTSIIDRSLTVDNMKNAPDQLKNANGNVIFNMFAMNLGLYVEKYSALEGDLKTANDFMNLYGFSFAGIGNIRDYANVRKYHNYIKAQLQSINGNLSNVARTDLRERFANGVRFWNKDTVSYDKENYENELED